MENGGKSLKKFFLISFLYIFPLQALTFAESELEKIGHKIWKNECNHTIEGLTSWNEGENFASCGIGHFIWYPKENRRVFEEQFPKFLEFAKKNAVKVPKWLNENTYCPWNSKQEFTLALQSEQMKELRSFLCETLSLQLSFILSNLESVLPKLTENLDLSQKEHLTKMFESLSKTPQGFFCLVDYLNFKGSGLNAKERYQGLGWGLQQVLMQMRVNFPPVEEFVFQAKQVLTKRVENAPEERNEKRWLKGWYNRLDTYLEF